MGQWIRNVKQHESYDKRDESRKDEKKRDGRDDKGCK
jgi:hypothetical protein